MRVFGNAIRVMAVVLGCASPALAGSAPPIESVPECRWSKSMSGEYICKGQFKLARGEGDPLHVGHCGTVFKAGRVIVTALEVRMTSRRGDKAPFHLVNLYLNRDQPEVTVIGGTFRSNAPHPEDVFCRFRARVRVL